MGAHSEQSVAAVNSFRARVERLGLWDGAWLGLLAIKGSTGAWVAFVVRAILTAPGAKVPGAPEVFDATTEHVRVRANKLPLTELWQLLEEVASGASMRLSAAFGEELLLPVGKNPASIHANVGSPWLRDRTHLQLTRYAGISFHELFGFEVFERLGPQLKAHRPNYAGPKEVVENMLPLSGSAFDNNNANPIFEVSAELPIGPVKAFFNPAQGGLEVGFAVGSAVPLDRVSMSIAPEPRAVLTASDLSAKREGDSIAFSHVLPCSEPEREVTVDLQFDDVAVGSQRIAPKSKGLYSWQGLGEPQRPEWELILEREFHWSRRKLGRQLRAVLPRRVAEVALLRISQAVEMREQFPFFSVVSAASVAELLVKERIAKVKKSAREAAWQILRAEDNKLPRKLPQDLKFDHSIRFASRLGLLDDVDSKSVDLLRIARNEVHLDRDSRPSHEDFSPVRASAAILAVLHLCTVVKRRAKRAKRAAPAAVHGPGASRGGAEPSRPKCMSGELSRKLQSIGAPRLNEKRPPVGGRSSVAP